MYTQSFNVPEQGEAPSNTGLKAVPKALNAQDTALQAQFDARIDANGKVANAKVEKSTDPAFDKPALDAVRKWKFEPAMKEGRKVSAKMRAPIRFDTKASS